MNSNDTKTLWIAVGSALFAVFLLYSWIQEKNKEMTDKFGKRKSVVVAKVDINEMTPLDETAVEMIEVPEEYIAPQAVTDPTELRGYVALNPIIKGEQILKTKISKPGALTGLSFQVSPGKRALTIPIDEMRSVARLLKPGDRVDIVASVVSGSGLNTKKEVKVLMQNTIILATGTNVHNQLPASVEMSNDGTAYVVKSMTQDTSFNSITIEASPIEAQKLIYILSNSPSDLFLVLRHPSDTGAVAKTVVDVNDILGRGGSAPQAQAPAARTPTASEAGGGAAQNPNFESRSNIMPSGGGSAKPRQRPAGGGNSGRFRSL